MMLMMDDEVVVEKAESVEKERSALAREIEFRLTPYLYQLGIPPHVTGYSYLRSAVVEFLLNPSEMREITKTIYPRIALEHGTTVSAVERAIRHAIATAWNNGGLRGIKGDPARWASIPRPTQASMPPDCPARSRRRFRSCCRRSSSSFWSRVRLTASAHPRSCRTVFTVCVRRPPV